MIKVSKYIPNIKPGTYFKNPNEKLRYEIIEIGFREVEEKLECFYDILKDIPQDIYALEKRSSGFLKKDRIKKETPKLKNYEKVLLISNTSSKNTISYMNFWQKFWTGQIRILWCK